MISGLIRYWRFIDAERDAVSEEGSRLIRTFDTGTALWLGRRGPGRTRRSCQLSNCVRVVGDAGRTGTPKVMNVTSRKVLISLLLSPLETVRVSRASQIRERSREQAELSEVLCDIV